MTKPQHGGPREGSGRPKQDDAGKTDRHNVSLDRATVKKATKLGNGNLSLGIRVAVRSAQDRNR